jgi:hypothetical protein
MRGIQDDIKNVSKIDDDSKPHSWTFPAGEKLYAVKRGELRFHS